MITVLNSVMNAHDKKNIKRKETQQFYAPEGF